MLTKMKNLFSGKKPSSKIDNSNKILSIITSSGISEENLKIITKHGKNEQDIAKALKEILLFPKTEQKKLLLQYSNIWTAFQIAKLFSFKQIIFTFNPSINMERYTTKAKIKVSIQERIDEDFDGLVVYNTEKPCAGITISTKTNADLRFLDINTENFGIILNEVLKNKTNIVGFSSSKSILDAHFSGKINQLFCNLCNSHSAKASAQINEMELVQKFQQNNSNVSINFDEILFSLDKIEELASTNMLSNFGVKFTPEMKASIIKQKTIINSMTAKERKNPAIIEHMRIQRIAKGSGASFEEVSKLVSMIDMIKKQGGNLAANLMSPNAMFNLQNKN